MSFFLHPFQIVAATLAEWVRREQEKRIEFLQEELDILREQFGDRRILLTDDERRVLAVKGMALDKEDLEKTCVIVQPDTLRRWHRELVDGNRYKSEERKTGRPITDQEIVDLVVRMARENPSWGYKRIEGALSNVGFDISSSTVANILKHHGIEPAPQRIRQLSWSTFMRAHMDVFEAVDLSKLFGRLVAGVLACLTTLSDHIRSAWSESERPMNEVEPIPSDDLLIFRFPAPENDTEPVALSATPSMGSRPFTRGPPQSVVRLESSPSDICAKAA